MSKRRDIPPLVTLIFSAIFAFGGVAVSAQEPKVVSVGAGSYAEFPPPASVDRNVAKILDMQPYIDDSKAGAPIPTNKWWTDLIASKYCGNLWADPVTVSASIEGIKVFHPDKWTEKGNDMALDFPLEIGGVAQGGQQSKDIVIADFEGPAYGPGWHTSGQAFGNGPAKGAFPGQTAVVGYMGKGLANSLFPDDNATGTLTSPPFRIQRRYIHFLIAGGRNPEKLRMKLLVNGVIKHSATGDDSERLKWQVWDVADLKGAEATIEIEDNAQGGWAHILVDQIIQSEEASPPAAGNGFAPVDARALRWGDWTVSFRMAHGPATFMDVTLGHGLPFVWTEFKGVMPVIKCGEGAVFYDSKGGQAGASVRSDEICIGYGGRFYGVFAPDNTAFQCDAGTVRVLFEGPQSYLVVGALPNKEALETFHRYAFAIPRDSRMDWTYDPNKAEVTTRWKLETEALKGSNHDLIQGWIPHHYRGTRQSLAFNGMEYLTARGLMKCAVGREFEIGFPFNGLLPTLPRPHALGGATAHDYDETRMRAYVTANAEKTKYGDDTYWGGKDLINFARYTSIAKELGCPEFETLRTKAHGALADWFTYTPGEKAHFFAMYPKWKALVGFKGSYGSEQFNDQHFHYGYFTTSAAVLGMYDPQFVKGYGDMTKLVAKEYANWDRTDTRFPFMRTFDIWEGHSWAGGTSSGNGENQESSSEAVNSWGGLFLLGSVLGDDRMTAAGAMGWSMETAATEEYWFDFYGHKQGAQASTFSPNYPHKVTGILGGGGRAYATYFSGEPAWIYGIQWLPASPSLIHLDRYPEFSQWQFDTMMADEKEHMARERNPKPTTILAMGNLGGVLLGFTMQFNPDWTAEQFDELWAARSGPDKYESGDIYYFTHANRMLGQVAWNCHSSIPTTTAYYNKTGNKYSWVIYNPKPTAQTATLYKDGEVAGTASIPANALVTVSP